VEIGTALTVQQFKQYDQIMNTIDLQARKARCCSDYSRKLHQAHARLKGWFGPVMELVQRLKGRMQDAEWQLKCHGRGSTRMNDAKTVVVVK
jgi:hypothetical protein